MVGSDPVEVERLLRLEDGKIEGLSMRPQFVSQGYGFLGSYLGGAILPPVVEYPGAQRDWIV